MAAPRDVAVDAAAALPVLRAIDAATTRDADHEAFPDGLWLALDRDPTDCHVALSPDGDIGVVAFPSDTFAPSHQQIAVGVLASASVEQLATTIAAIVNPMDGGHRVVAWVPGSDPRILDALHEQGFAVDRVQHQMRVPLPLAERAVWPESVSVRAFRPGLDEPAWLDVNNRAFANHPDQGAWIKRTLERRMEEPWFDPQGFLLAWRDTTLLGFCWTKVAAPLKHSEPERGTSGGEQRGSVPTNTTLTTSERTSLQDERTSRKTGEIFVIGVDPDAQGLGLGRALVIGGLEYLAEGRGCDTGVLYVAAGNAAAVGLYRSLGFVVHRTDTAVVRSEKDDE